ncbi:LPS export ABC transporter permease LptF [Thermoproteota archaeon]
MRIIHRYLLKEFLAAFLLSAFVLTLVMTLGNIIFLVGLIITKGVPIMMIFKLLLYSLPSSVQFIIPISIMAGLLLSLGRLSSDNEIISIRSSGMNMARIIAPLLVLGLIFTSFSFLINDRVTPTAHLKNRVIVKDLGTKNPAAILEPGIFINAFDKYVLFVYEINGNKFRNIRIYEPMGEGKPPRTIIAKRGEFIALPEENILKLKLIDGTADEIDTNNPSNFYKINFHTYFMTLDFAANKPKHGLGKKAKDMTLKELWAKILDLRSRKFNADPIASEFHKRIAISFSPMIFFLLGIPIGIITRRREKTANIVVAFLIVGVYFILMLCVEALCSQGNLAPSSGMWIPNIIFGILGIYLSGKLCVF